MAYCRYSTKKSVLYEYNNYVMPMALGGFSVLGPRQVGNILQKEALIVPLSEHASEHMQLFARTEVGGGVPYPRFHRRVLGARKVAL